MARKISKKTITNAVMELNPTELSQIVNEYNKTHGSSVDTEDTLKDEMERKLIAALSPVKCIYCNSDVAKNGKHTESGLQRFKCKNCGRKFTLLSNTILDKSPIPWNVWVLVLQYMLGYQSIEDIHYLLIANHHIPSISESTVSIMTKKLREMFVYLPLPQLTGVIQVDEKHFHESQKGFENPYDVLNSGQRRTGHERAVKAQYGSLGPEFSTICCMVDEAGRSVAKVLTMGRMTLEMFEDEMQEHIVNPTFLCSDMNPIYGQWCALHDVPQYCINSKYHDIIKDLDTDDKKQYAYEQDKLDYIVGKGIMSYKAMCKMKKKHKLGLNRVNAYHNELERLINRVAKGVSTKHLQSWVSFYNYINNFKVDNGRLPLTYNDAEGILIEMVKLRKDIDVKDIKEKKDLTKKVPKRYTNNLITWTVNARVKSNNPHVKLDEDDGLANFNKKYFVEHIPEYKRRQLAKLLGIKPFSPVAVGSNKLKKQILTHPDLEEGIYKLLGTKKIDVD